MIQSTYRHHLKTLKDNSLFWKCVDYLRNRSYRVAYDIPHIDSGNTITIEVYPYPHPDHLSHIKLIFAEIDRLAKKENKNAA